MFWWRSQLHGVVVSTPLRTAFQIYLTPTDCKSLAPTWESVAQDFVSEPTVVVAKVDAEAENSKITAEAHGVKSYPTLKFFPKGSTTSEDYDGGRSEEDIVAFINQKSGTHRIVGGGLDAEAGTIEALDTIIAKVSGSNLASISEELSKAAKAVETKYSEYYVKVLGKVAASKDYADKELKRLEKILKKGGLTSEKTDDVTSRSNILRKFIPQEQTKDEL